MAMSSKLVSAIVYKKKRGREDERGKKTPSRVLVLLLMVETPQPQIIGPQFPHLQNEYNNNNTLLRGSNGIMDGKQFCKL